MKAQNIIKGLVRETAERMMVNFNKTTTLEVKNELRALGYFATQAETSDFMMGLSDEMDWRWNNKTDNGHTYRVYELPDGYITNYNAPVAVSQTNSTAPVSTATTTSTGKIYTKKDGNTVEAYADENDAIFGDWVVTSIVNSTKLVFPLGNYTRDEVRQAYAKIVGVKFHDTRTTYVK